MLLLLPLLLLVVVVVVSPPLPPAPPLPLVPVPVSVPDPPLPVVELDEVVSDELHAATAQPRVVRSVRARRFMGSILSPTKAAARLSGRDSIIAADS